MRKSGRGGGIKETSKGKRNRDLSTVTKRENRADVQYLFIDTKKSYQVINHHIHQRSKEALLSSQLLMRISHSATQDPPQHVTKDDPNNTFRNLNEKIHSIFSVFNMEQLSHPRPVLSGRPPSDSAMVMVRAWSANTRYAMSIPSASSAPTLPV